jgi:methylated-DNA-protein-cysteine methyltransferase-like protein
MRKRLNDTFYEKVKAIIRSVPKGKVATYGQIAAYAGNPRGARQVAWVLHSSSRKYDLPWHRIVGSRGKISLKPMQGYELQKSLLIAEGVAFDGNDYIDLEKYQWRR